MVFLKEDAPTFVSWHIHLDIDVLGASIKRVEMSWTDEFEDYVPNFDEKLVENEYPLAKRPVSETASAKWWCLPATDLVFQNLGNLFKNFWT